MHIHFIDKNEDSSFFRFSSLLAEYSGSQTHTVSRGAEEAPANIDIAIGGRPEAEFFDAHPELGSLIVPWAGPPPKTIEMIAERPSLSMYNLHHNDVPVAEMALGLLLAACRLIPLRDRKMREGTWFRSVEYPGILLRGKTAVCLGAGAIFQALEPALLALGVDIKIIRKHPDANSGREFSMMDLHDCLNEADFLINTLPLTDETRGLIGATELKLLGRSGVVVNVGRGAVINQEALYSALKEGWIHSAGIDVWYNYPDNDKPANEGPGIFPSDFPLQDLDNVVMTPHIAGEYTAQEVEELRMEHLARLVAKICSGTPLRSFNTSRGY